MYAKQKKKHISIHVNHVIRIKKNPESIYPDVRINFFEIQNVKKPLS